MGPEVVEQQCKIIVLSLIWVVLLARVSTQEKGSYADLRLHDPM